MGWEEGSADIDSRDPVSACGRYHRGRFPGRTGGVARIHPAGLDPPDGGAPSDPGACQPRLPPVSLAQSGWWVRKNVYPLGARASDVNETPRRPDSSWAPVPPRASVNWPALLVLHPFLLSPSSDVKTKCGSFSIDFAQRSQRKKPGGGEGGCLPTSLRRPVSLLSPGLIKPSLATGSARRATTQPPASPMGVRDPGTPQEN